MANSTEPRETFGSITITDLHFDFNYSTSESATCTFPLCCRDNGIHVLPLKNWTSPGRYGHYLCDVPAETVTSMYDFIHDHLAEWKAKFITINGDYSSHNIWHVQKDLILSYTKYITDEFQARFNETDLEVFPVMGNHDAHKPNDEDFSAPAGSNELLKDYAKLWNQPHWLSDEEAAQFKRYGYYSKSRRG